MHDLLCKYSYTTVVWTITVRVRPSITFVIWVVGSWWCVSPCSAGLPWSHWREEVVPHQYDHSYWHPWRQWTHAEEYNDINVNVINMKTLSFSPFSPTFLPASWLTISPPSATSSANSGIILLGTSSCWICGGRGVVCMTETTCKCTAVVTKNNYHSDDQCPSPLPSLTHTLYLLCTFPKMCFPFPTHTHPPTHTHSPTLP